MVTSWCQVGSMNPDTTRDDRGDLLTAPEVAEVLKVHVEHVRRLWRLGVLPSFSLYGRGTTSRLRRMRRSDLEAWIDDQASAA